MFTKQKNNNKQMKSLKPFLVSAVLGLLSISMYSCKTKKIVAKPAPVEKVAEKPVEEKKPDPAPVQEEKPAAPEKPNFNFNNVQFEFNSDVLKTASFSILDQAAAEMKKDTSINFVLNGNSSAEGTVEHNMSLSVDRANAVKSYLVNAGISASRLSIKGFGATRPLTSNDTEAGRQLNRRVEVKVVQ
ncbi:OmpA family protein [Pedobacter nutrimenti]|uniref:OOP family OmpA-OmpF porin n=1 Tax=Pedobacter nutrimenti TaxID=1241337 RepID=A0A318UHP1_9SPHI|nr:OmpA family protein [Pedobacter nutrimenti]PYF75653.1 OOP family OmpA-OmpF porin [Pedobacter nutrimenti]